MLSNKTVELLMLPSSVYHNTLGITLDLTPALGGTQPRNQTFLAAKRPAGIPKSELPPPTSTHAGLLHHPWSPRGVCLTPHSTGEKTRPHHCTYPASYIKTRIPSRPRRRKKWHHPNALFFRSISTQTPITSTKESKTTVNPATSALKSLRQKELHTVTPI